jgi:hypothetical protein
MMQQKPFYAIVHLIDNLLAPKPERKPAKRKI